MLRDRRATGAWRRPPLALRIVSCLMALTAVAACGSETRGSSGPATSPPPTEPAPTTTIDPHLSYVAEAIVPEVAVFDAPDAPQPRQAFPNPHQYGAPLVFLVENHEDGPPDWLHVFVPTRPNGSTGWIRVADVNVVSTPFRVVVELGAHQLTVWERDQVFHQEPVGVGTNNTPTPTGLFYVRALVESVGEQQAKYGPYVYVLSGFSDVHLSFEGGQGETAIHGTHNLANLGQEVSNGCIRMSNDGISKLAGVLPLGVPVEVRP